MNGIICGSRFGWILLATTILSAGHALGQEYQFPIAGLPGAKVDSPAAIPAPQPFEAVAPENVHVTHKMACSTGCDDCATECESCPTSAGCHCAEPCACPKPCACPQTCDPCPAPCYGRRRPVRTLMGDLKHKIHSAKWEMLYPHPCWPSYYAREARGRVTDIMRSQVVNGNKIELTVWDFYFHKEASIKDQLNPAGIRRLQYLARRRPYVIPTLRMQDTFDDELNEARITTVINAMKRFTRKDFDWQVVVVNEVPQGLFGIEGERTYVSLLQALGAPAVKVTVGGIGIDDAAE